MNNSPGEKVSRHAWTIGTLFSAMLAGLSILGLLANVEWGYASVNAQVRNLPEMIAQQGKNTTDIAKLQTQQANSDTRFTEILSQLARLNDKLDRRDETHR